MPTWIFLLLLISIVLTFAYLRWLVNTYRYSSIFYLKNQYRKKVISPNYKYESDQYGILLSDANIRNVIKICYPTARTNIDINEIYFNFNNLNYLILNYDRIKLSLDYTFNFYSINKTVDDICWKLYNEIDHSKSWIIYGEGINANIALSMMRFNLDLKVVAINILQESNWLDFVSYLNDRSKYNRFVILNSKDGYVTNNNPKPQNFNQVLYNDIFDDVLLNQESYSTNAEEFIGIGSDQPLSIDNPLPNFQECFKRIQHACYTYSTSIYRSKVCSIFYDGWTFIFITDNDDYPMELNLQYPICILGGFDTSSFAFRLYSFYKFTYPNLVLRLVLFNSPLALVDDINIISSNCSDKIQLYDIAVKYLVSKKE